MGITHQRMPRLLTLIYWERASKPWNSSCSTTATIERDDPVAERDDRVDAGDPQRFLNARGLSGGLVERQDRIDEEQEHHPDHRDRREDDADRAHDGPEPAGWSDPVDEIPSAFGS